MHRDVPAAEAHIGKGAKKDLPFGEAYTCGDITTASYEAIPFGEADTCGCIVKGALVAHALEGSML